MSEAAAGASLPLPHSPEWYDRLSLIQDGYYYPWRSAVGARNGEDAYLEVLHEHLTSETVALDVGCGDGRLTVEVAGKCSRVVGYDRVRRYIDSAKQHATGARAFNCEFVVGNAKECVDEPNSGRIPASDDTFDLVFSRRGPLNYLSDVRRVTRDNAWIVHLNPAFSPPPDWARLLPNDLFISNLRPAEFGILETVRDRLASAGLRIHSYWFFDVPERFVDPAQLCVFLLWNFLDEAPYTFDDLRKPIERVFQECSAEGAVELRHRRLLWTCHIRE
jgi:SAM-dependent methyltransferase